MPPTGQPYLACCCLLPPYSEAFLVFFLRSGSSPTLPGVQEGVYLRAEPHAGPGACRRSQRAERRERGGRQTPEEGNLGWPRGSWIELGGGIHVSKGREAGMPIQERMGGGLMPAHGGGGAQAWVGKPTRSRVLSR